jgi:shikimate dehydrogenase
VATISLTGVLGQPVAHSRSPAMHNAAFEALGLAPDWRYVAVPISGELFDETVRALPGSGYRGANVTIPHKLLALAIADEATDAARGAGAANTLTFGDAGQIHADNTDVGGLLDAIGDAPDRALVLGAGGAARGAIWALRGAGTDVMVWNRTSDRAEALAAELEVRAAPVVDPSAYDAVVNATSIGLDATLSDASALAALGLEGRAAPALVVDLVYRGAGAATPLQHWAEDTGARFVDGLEILVRQGARSFEIWTGRKPPVSVMRQAARA